MRLLDAKVSASPIETKCEGKSLVVSANKSDAFSQVLQALGASAAQSGPSPEPSTDQKSPEKCAVETVDVSNVATQAPVRMPTTTPVRVAPSMEEPALVEGPVSSISPKTTLAAPKKSAIAKQDVRTAKREPRAVVATAPTVTDVIALTIAFVAPRTHEEPGVTVELAAGDASPSPPSGFDVPKPDRSASLPSRDHAKPAPVEQVALPTTTVHAITEPLKVAVTPPRPIAAITATPVTVGKTTPSTPKSAARPRIEPARQQPASEAAAAPNEGTIDAPAPEMQVDAPLLATPTGDEPTTHRDEHATHEVTTTEEPREEPTEPAQTALVTRAQVPSAKALTVPRAEVTANASAPVARVEAPLTKTTTSNVVGASKETTPTAAAVRVERVLEAVKLHVAHAEKSARVDIGHGDSKVTATIRVEDHRVTVHLVTADVDLRSRLQTGLITLARDLKQRGFELDRVASSASLPSERTFSPRAVTSSQGMRFGTDAREHRERQRADERDEEQERAPSQNGRRTIAGRTYLG